MAIEWEAGFRRADLLTLRINLLSEGMRADDEPDGSGLLRERERERLRFCVKSDIQHHVVKPIVTADSCPTLASQKSEGPLADYVLQLGEGGEENERLVLVRSGVVVGAVTDPEAIRVAKFLAANEKPESGINRACLLRNGRVIWSGPLLEASAQLKTMAAKE